MPVFAALKPIAQITDPGGRADFAFGRVLLKPERLQFVFLRLAGEAPYVFLGIREQDQIVRVPHEGNVPLLQKQIQTMKIDIAQQRTERRAL